jgi:uncharacterized protein YneF (UPF0154 family)
VGALWLGIVVGVMVGIVIGLWVASRSIPPGRR